VRERVLYSKEGILLSSLGSCTSDPQQERMFAMPLPRAAFFAGMGMHRLLYSRTLSGGWGVTSGVRSTSSCTYSPWHEHITTGSMAKPSADGRDVTVIRSL
jgi:hypothetical protein